MINVEAQKKHHQQQKNILINNKRMQLYQQIQKSALKQSKSRKKRNLDETATNEDDSTRDTNKRQRARIVTEASNKEGKDNKGSDLLENGSSSDHNELMKKMYKTYLKNAFEALEKNNDNSQLLNLTGKIEASSSHGTCSEGLSYSAISTILKLLLNEVSRLDSKQCSSLINAVLNLSQWAKQDESFIQDYITFLMVLTSGIPKWHHEIVRVLMRDFSRLSCGPHSSSVIENRTNNENNKNNIQDSRLSFAKGDEDPRASRTESKSHTTLPHHQYFKYLIRIIPTSLNFFVKQLVRNIPDKYGSKHEAVNYVDNLVEVMRYAPEIRFPLLSAIVEYCIKLDVELKSSLDEADDDVDLVIGDEDDEDDDEDEEDKEDDEDEEEDDEEDDDDEDEDDEGEEEYGVDLSININKLLAKLDCVMEKLIIYLQESFTLQNLSNGDGIPLYRSLISIFKSHVLSTSNTRSIQFLLFHFSQQRPELIDAFLVTLIDTTFNFSESLEQRIKAVQYLSSYMARAKQVLKAQLVFVVSYLVSWINRYVDERECEVEDGNGGMERFKMFYAVVQCLMYIFCFRHEQLQKDENSDDNATTGISSSNSKSKWECAFDQFFQKVILTKFNPLKFCNETVVMMFAKIAHQQNVAYCFTLIEHNRRDQYNGHKKSGLGLLANRNSSLNLAASANTLISSIGNTSTIMKKDTTNRILFFSKQEFLDLVAYFPFDPLILKRCRAIIKDNYVEWGAGETVDDESDSNSDDYDDGASYAREVVRRQSMNTSLTMVGLDSDGYESDAIDSE